MRLHRALVACCVLVGGVAATTLPIDNIAAGSAAAAPAPEALVVGDSVLAGVSLYPGALAALQARHPVIFDAAVCRRLVAPSCSYQGTRPLTALGVLQADRGQFGSTLVVGAGYYDTGITPALDAILAEARAQGVTSVLWLTYRESGANAGRYAGFNATLRARDAAEPDLHVLDWAALSATHPEWAAGDGLHLSPSGAAAMASFIADGIDAHGRPNRCAEQRWVGTAPPGTPPDTGSAPAGGIHPLAEPYRMLDTRELAGKLGRGRSLEVPIVGRGGVAADATAALATVVAVEACADVFVAAYPCGAGIPPTSVVNADAGSIVANGALVKLSPTGSLCLYANAPVDVVVDVAAYVAPGGSAPRPSTPERLVDTRPGYAQRLAIPQRRLAAGTTLAVPVSTLPGLGSATAVAVNLAAVDPAGDGFLTMYPGPCAKPRPLAANLNVAGRTRAAGATSAVGAGTVCIFTSVDTDIALDLNATYGPGSTRLVTVAPDRLLDTRETVTVPVHGTVVLDLDDPALGAPANAVGLVGSLATTEPVAPGFLTVHPCTLPRPNVSNLNMSTGQTVANLFVSGVDANRQVCIFSLSSTQVIVDLEGWITR